MALAKEKGGGGKMNVQERNTKYLYAVIDMSEAFEGASIAPGVGKDHGVFIRAARLHKWGR